jgi:predicted Zn finger-like uncharacterized protein
MIVVCTTCHAKFRVSDEKIGPRGAKVRCSRCRTVFPVRSDGTATVEGAPSSPPAEGGALDSPRTVPHVDLEAGAPAPAPFGLADPFSTGALALSTPPAAPAIEAAAAVLRTVPPPLPGTRPPAPQPSTRGGDPFAEAGIGGALAPPSAAPDAGWASDSDVSQAGGNGPDALPLTDLSDLLGPATPTEVPRPDAAGSGEPPADAPPDDGGLSLEERLTPPPLAVAGAADPFAEPASFPGLDAGVPALATAPSGDPFAPGASTFVPGAYDDEPLPGEELLALARERAEPQPAAPVPPAPALAPAPAQAAQGQASTEDRVVVRRQLPLRSITVNAVALAALLAIALAMLAVWRSEGPFQIGMLRPSALVAALRTSARPPPFAAADVRSGTYERDKGPPILFVRGRIVSRAPQPVRSVRVAVEVVRDGQVIARGAALAGAVPTPEELWAAPDASALEVVARAASARAPGQVRPGDRVPFLVAIADHPADLDGATLRFDLSPQEGKAP